MTDAVILSACRTAIGTARKGSLADTDPFDLAELTVAEAVARSGLAPELIDEVVYGESLAGGGAIARHAAIAAGLVSAAGTAVNRHCASGLAVTNMAAASVLSGMESAVVAGGVQSASLAPVCTRRIPGTDEWTERWLSPSHPPTDDAPTADMSITVGWNAARLADVSREAMDEWAYHSHRKAIEAIDAGRFDDEVIPVEVLRRDGTKLTFAVDEHPRRDTSLEKLASLKPIHPEIEGFSITAGNSSGVNDGAGAMVVAASDLAEREGLEVLARIRSWAAVGVPPVETGLAPITVIPKALERAGLRSERRHALRDQRGFRLRGRGDGGRPRDRPGQGQPERQRLQPGPPRRDDGDAHADDAGLRAPPARRWDRGRGDVRRRRHGHRHRHRGLRTVSPWRRRAGARPPRRR